MLRHGWATCKSPVKQEAPCGHVVSSAPYHFLHCGSKHLWNSDIHRLQGLCWGCRVPGLSSACDFCTGVVLVVSLLSTFRLWFSFRAYFQLQNELNCEILVFMQLRLAEPLMSEGKRWFPSWRDLCICERCSWFSVATETPNMSRQFLQFQTFDRELWLSSLEFHIAEHLCSEWGWSFVTYNFDILFLWKALTTLNAWTCAQHVSSPIHYWILMHDPPAMDVWGTL